MRPYAAHPAGGQLSGQRVQSGGRPTPHCGYPAIRKMAGNHDVAVLCLVYYDLTYEKEAALYYKLDQAKGQLRSGHAIKALLESCTINASLVRTNNVLTFLRFRLYC